MHRIDTGLGRHPRSTTTPSIGCVTGKAAPLTGQGGVIWRQWFENQNSGANGMWPSVHRYNFSAFAPEDTPNTHTLPSASAFGSSGPYSFSGRAFNSGARSLMRSIASSRVLKLSTCNSFWGPFQGSASGETKNLRENHRWLLGRQT